MAKSFQQLVQAEAAKLEKRLAKLSPLAQAALLKAESDAAWHAKNEQLAKARAART
jgi:hypothetical protein